MDQLPIFNQSTSVFKKLAHLLSNIPSELRDGLSINFQSKIQKVSRLYSSIQPEEVLQDLLDKTSATALRKNWKYEEISYLIYIADKYCLRHEIEADGLDSLDW